MHLLSRKLFITFWEPNKLQKLNYVDIFPIVNVEKATPVWTDENSHALIEVQLQQTFFCQKLGWDYR